MKPSRILIVVGAVLVVASAAFAVEAVRPHWEHFFARLDANGDGVISKAEMAEHMEQHEGFHQRGPGGPGHPGPGGLFVYSADADRNREVTTAEWEAFLDKALGADGRLSAEELTALMPERRSGDERPHRAEHMAAFLDHLDRDGNDVVDAADFNAIFAQLDEDDDGTLEAGEFGHRCPGCQHRGPRR
jgi:Ca2+-binding EF-hand superfamily protein